MELLFPELELVDGLLQGNQTACFWNFVLLTHVYTCLSDFPSKHKRTFISGSRKTSHKHKHSDKQRSKDVTQTQTKQQTALERRHTNTNIATNSARKTLHKHKHSNKQRSRNVTQTQTQQQTPESPTVTLRSKYKVRNSTKGHFLTFDLIFKNETLFVRHASAP